MRQKEEIVGWLKWKSRASDLIRGRRVLRKRRKRRRERKRRKPRRLSVVEAEGSGCLACERSHQQRHFSTERMRCSLVQLVLLAHSEALWQLVLRQEADLATLNYESVLGKVYASLMAFEHVEAEQ